MVGGVLVAEPGGSHPSVGWHTLSLVARLAFAPLFRDASQAMTLVHSDPAIRFCLVRCGRIVEAPSRGALVPSPCASGRGLRCSVSYVDLGAALVELAGNDRVGACYVDYALGRGHTPVPPRTVLASVLRD